MSSLLQLLLLLSVLVLLAKLAGWLAARLGQPPVLGEILVGLLIGPTVLNLLQWPALASAETQATLNHLAEIGVILLMLIAGLEVDLQDLRRSGWSALLGGLCGVIATVAVAWGLSRLFGYSSAGAFAIGVLATATSVSISAQTLLELGRLRTPEGITMLGAGVVDDVLVILLLSVVVGLSSGDSGVVGVLLTMGRMGLFIGVGGFLCLWGLPRLMRLVERWPVSAAVPSVVLIVTFFIAWAADFLGGIGGITGAFLVGLGLRRSPLHRGVTEAMHTVGYALFVPLFFVSVGLHANLRGLDARLILFAVSLIALVVVVKVVANGLGARAGGAPPGVALRMGIGMIPRGEVSLIAATVEISEGLIGESLFSVVMLLVLTTALVTPPLLRLAYRRATRPPAQPAAGEGPPAPRPSKP